jgi:hypothetical protein
LKQKKSLTYKQKLKPNQATKSTSYTKLFINKLQLNNINLDSHPQLQNRRRANKKFKLTKNPSLQQEPPKERIKTTSRYTKQLSYRIKIKDQQDKQSRYQQYLAFNLTGQRTTYELIPTIPTTNSNKQDHTKYQLNFNHKKKTNPCLQINHNPSHFSRISAKITRKSQTITNFSERKLKILITKVILTILKCQNPKSQGQKKRKTQKQYQWTQNRTRGRVPD